MKKIIAIASLIVIVFSLNAQEMVKNGGFEEIQSLNVNYKCGIAHLFNCHCDEGLLCRNDQIPFKTSCDGSTKFDANPFILGKLKFWHSAHGTPQVEQIGCFDHDVASGNVSAFIDGSVNNKEGIFQDDINLEVGTVYNISFNVKSPAVSIFIADGLHDTDGVFGSSFPNISSKEKLFPNNTANEIITFNSATGFTHVEIKNYKVLSQHSQLWIFSQTGANIIDDISIVKTCCINHQTYENITNPPNTHVTEWIHANPNQPHNNTSVEYTIPTARNWTAQNNIQIKQNFHVGRHTTFNAKLKDCNTITLDGYLEKVDHLPGLDYCASLLSADVCFGSGDYSYEWRADGELFSTDRAVLVNYATHKSIELKITDNQTSEIIIRRLDYWPCGCPPIDMKTGWPSADITYCPEKDGRYCFRIGPDAEKDINYNWTCSDGSKLTWLDDVNKSNPLLCLPPNATIPPGLTYMLTATPTGKQECSQTKNITIHCCTPTIDIPAYIELCAKNCYNVPLAPVHGYTYQWTDLTGINNPNYTISSFNIANPTVCFNNPFPQTGGTHASKVQLSLTVTNACGETVTRNIEIIEPGYIYNGCKNFGVNLDYVQNTKTLRCIFSVHNGLENIVKHITVKIFDENHLEIGSRTFYDGVDFTMPTQLDVTLDYDNLNLDCNKTYYIQYFYGTDCSYYDIPFIDSQSQINLNCI